ncbi:MAG: nitronate monooxygenase [Sedimentibacter sp.]|uniref:nitronate monooxygenase n=1 Tax=Sedimentibacter sp. TaxID=1960295 RepID=UPI0031585AAF
MKTKLTELLKIEYPIIQGAMAWVSESELAAAVSEAGGAGIIGTGGRSASWVFEEIRKARTLTNKPFGMNVMLMDRNKDEIVDIICSEKVSFVTMGAGNPVLYFEKLKSAGIKVIPVVSNVKQAKSVCEKGADAIVAEGMESGGHIGTLTTMALLTQVIPEVNIPVIAAGGISDGRGFAAAVVMGAAGIQMGTRFYASRECRAHINAKNAIVNAVDTDTIVTGYGTAHVVRGLKNKMTDKYFEMVSRHAAEDELNELFMGTARKAPDFGDIEWGYVHAGQSLTVIKSIESCRDIITSTTREAKEAFSRTKNCFE